MQQKNKLNQNTEKLRGKIDPKELERLQLSVYCTYLVGKSIGLRPFGHWGNQRPVFWRTREEVKQIAAQLT